MIRFCDKDVCDISEEEWETTVIWNCMILGEDIWKDGHRCSERNRKRFGEAGLIPVVDKKRNLRCFAYQDGEANREIRMLEELMECKNALGFCDVYPEFDCVTIHGCNELAYDFRIYLKKMGIPVNVVGALWKEIGVEKETEMEVFGDKNFDVYAEGVSSRLGIPELRMSVSPEFECVDKIYEMNILHGIIHDAEGKDIDFFERLEGKSVGILGWDEVSLNAWDLLLEHGIDICCFISEGKSVDDRNIFGKRIVNRIEALSIWEDIVLIEVNAKNSAWGFGGTDRYHYLGYKRNRKFFLMQDYMDIPANGLKNVLRHMLESISGRIILTGDVWLCLAVEQGLEKNLLAKGRLAYCDILLNGGCGKTVEMSQICEKEICQDDFCLLLLPKYYACVADDNKKRIYRAVLREKFEENFKEQGIYNFYSFFEDADFIRWAWRTDNDSILNLKPGKIILGAINYYSGNIFFGGILENHPDIIMLQNHESYLHTNLYAFCIRLSGVQSQMVLPLFWELYDEGIKSCVVNCEFPSKSVFNRSMSEFLAEKERFTSQELFVMIHISYAKAQGKKIRNISDMVIYWEPHNVPREKCEEYAEWLVGVGYSSYIINVVRNACIRAGSNLKFLMDNDKSPVHMMESVLDFPNKAKKSYCGWKRICLMFEELKCNPKETLQLFCEQAGIKWSDAFLDVQASYKGVTGFDLTPVYRDYEEYLSSFDRFRISLIVGPWQKQYGYPYIDSLEFSRRELLEMFLKKFRFEEALDFHDNEQKMVFFKWRRRQMSEWLWRVRRDNLLQESENVY